MLARALVLCLTVSFAAAVLTGCGSRDESGEADFNRSEVRSLVLAPRDLGRGYTYGDDSFCGGLSPESSSEKFADFVHDADPEACGMEMYYAFRNARATGPARAVQSGAVVLDTADDARRALTLRKELIQYITGESPRDFAGAGDFGHDFLPGVVVRVNPVLCLYPCSSRSPSVRDPYNSRAGIEAVVRGLRLRPRQVD